METLRDGESIGKLKEIFIFLHYDFRDASPFTHSGNCLGFSDTLIPITGHIRVETQNIRVRGCSCKREKILANTTKYKIPLIFFRRQRKRHVGRQGDRLK